jgi:hypothetical protein
MPPHAVCPRLLPPHCDRLALPLQYARETDSILASQRRENRHRLFSLYMERLGMRDSSHADSTDDADAGAGDLYKEHFGKQAPLQETGHSKY